MNVKELQYVYFVGVGGIGMSALARYFNFLGKKVYGYDKTPSKLIDELVAEGISVHFDDSVELVPAEIRDASQKQHVLVIYTPAVPANHSELTFFMNNGFTVMKRSQALGLIIKNKRGIAIAGTHGKTSVTTTTTHLFRQSDLGCSAFLGGISKNYNTNFLFSAGSEYVVVEADEYDRSFHQLFPEIAVVTAMDADHLDIYGTHQAVIESFFQFMSQITTGGILIYKHGLDISPVKATLDQHAVKTFTYAMNDSRADFHATNIRKQLGCSVFDLVTPSGTINDITFHLPGPVNIENSVAASAVAWCSEIPSDIIAGGLSSFSGVRRRFDFHLKTDKVVLIDDYAHHPEELRASISSVKDFYPGKKITVIFQPHLYSRTKDFAAEFAKSLSLADELILLEIYPAREQPIPGVTSDIIFDKVTISPKMLITKSLLIDTIKKGDYEVLMTVGAGDIDTYIEEIKKVLSCGL